MVRRLMNHSTSGDITARHYVRLNRRYAPGDADRRNKVALPVGCCVTFSRPVSRWVDKGPFRGQSSQVWRRIQPTSGLSLRICKLPHCLLPFGVTNRAEINESVSRAILQRICIAAKAEALELVNRYAPSTTGRRKLLALEIPLIGSLW